MDPVAGFDDDEHEDFFRGYAAEAESESPSELEELEPSSPSVRNKGRRAGSARFQKPVALFVGAMTLLSIVGLALRGVQPGSWLPSAPPAEAALVTHYAAALPAAPVVSAAPALAYEPVSWEAACAGPNMCLLDSSADSAWLSVALTESSGSENNALSGYASNARARRSSLGSRFSASAHLTPIAHVAPVVAAPRAVVAAPRAVVAAPRAVVAAPRTVVAAPRVPTLSLAAAPPQRAATPPSTVTPVARFPDPQ